MAESQLEKDASKERVEYTPKNSAVVKKPILKTKTTKSKKASAQAHEITNLKQNTKKKILAIKISPPKPSKSNPNRLAIKDNNLESKKSCSKG